MNIYIHNTKGYITLISTLIVGAISLSIGLSLLMLGTDSSRKTLVEQQSLQARSLATTCAEAALQEIRNDTGFSGTDTIVVGQGECTYTVTILVGESRDIESTGTVGAVIRKVHVTLDQINPSINLTLWEDVADF